MQPEQIKIQILTYSAGIEVDTTTGAIRLYVNVGQSSTVCEWLKRELDGGAFVQRANPSEDMLLFEWEGGEPETCFQKDARLYLEREKSREIESTRQEFAKSALQGLLPLWEVWTKRTSRQRDVEQAFAETSVRIADALIRELAKTNE